ncbi:MAG: hypothetical protein Alpg2KO_25600 [Alphaproteobacteria bacterium]
MVNETRLDEVSDLQPGTTSTARPAGRSVALDGGTPIVIKLPGMEVDGTESGPAVAEGDPGFSELFNPSDIRAEQEKTRPPQQPMPGWIRLYLGQPGSEGQQ